MNKLQNIKIKLIALHLLVLRDRYPISPREQTNPYIGNIAHQCVANFSNLLTKVNYSLLKKMKYPFSYLFFDTKITILLYNLNTLIKKTRFYTKLDGREEAVRVKEESTAGLFYSSSFQITPLLISFKRYTIICSQNKIHISKRFMMSSSGSGAAGKGPKLPPSSSGSSSESKVPNTPYKKENLHKGAETALTNPMQDPYVPPSYLPPQVSTQSSPQLPPTVIKEEPKTSFSAKINEPYYKNKNAIETAQAHQNLPQINSPKTQIKTPTVTNPNINEPVTTSPIISTPLVVTEDLVKLKILEEKESTPVESKVLQENKDLVGIKVKPNARDANGQFLKPHEVGKSDHVLVGERDKNAGTIEAAHILTSAKKNGVTGEPNIKIDDNNYKQTGKPQRIAELETSRLFLNEQEGKSFEVDKDATDFINNPARKEKVQDVLDSKPKKHMTTRPHKDDAELYTEDGILHSDDKDIEREPIPKTVETDASILVSDTPNESDIEKPLDDVD